MKKYFHIISLCKIVFQLCFEESKECSANAGTTAGSKDETRRGLRSPAPILPQQILGSLFCSLVFCLKLHIKTQSESRKNMEFPSQLFDSYFSKKKKSIDMQTIYNTVTFKTLYDYF